MTVGAFGAAFLTEYGLLQKLHHHLHMIVGNPNAGKKIATATIALLLMMIVIITMVAVRKRTAPVKEPPLHPSIAILRL